MNHVVPDLELDVEVDASDAFEASVAELGAGIELTRIKSRPDPY